MLHQFATFFSYKVLSQTVVHITAVCPLPWVGGGGEQSKVGFVPALVVV